MLRIWGQGFYIGNYRPAKAIEWDSVSKRKKAEDKMDITCAKGRLKAAPGQVEVGPGSTSCHTWLWLILGKEKEERMNDAIGDIGNLWNMY